MSVPRQNVIEITVECYECAQPLVLEWENGAIGDLPNYFVKPHACDTEHIAETFGFDSKCEVEQADQHVRVFTEEIATVEHVTTGERVRVDWNGHQAKNLTEAFETLTEKLKTRVGAE